MEKHILEQYVDACGQVRETEKEIRKLEGRRRKVQDSVKGSNPEFPYEARSFHVEGTAEEASDYLTLKYEEQFLKEQKAQAQKLKLEVEAWMRTLPIRKQRIIRMRVFEGLSWQQVADKIGRKATGESIRKEYGNFMKARKLKNAGDIKETP